MTGTRFTHAQLSLPGLALITLTIAGCGFQLRGAAPVSSALQPLAVQCADQVPLELCEAVTDQLTLGEVRLVEAPNADYLLRLNSFSQKRRASAITVEAAAAEYDLRHSVRMDVITADQVPLIAEAEIHSSETYRYDETNVLAKQREEQEIIQNLTQRLAQQIIFRLVPLTAERIQVLRDQASHPAEKTDSGAQ
ncbi:LPS assembly lipoprotein LptE [Marinobacter caseinilyticus]|uniref:LPS-assembly lipoprotein LptE n=1 Tax=Marinobacter caseinilyticus TaxID=2692195 RepID=UPI00140A092B|nr:LPS assembly lipoprotein LptE [Marinobacter caseinilyticus]